MIHDENADEDLIREVIEERRRQARFMAWLRRDEPYIMHPDDEDGE